MLQLPKMPKLPILLKVKKTKKISNEPKILGLVQVQEMTAVPNQK